MAMKLKVNDEVMVTAGSVKGSVGKISKINRETSYAEVSGVKEVKKTRKPNQLNRVGGIENIDAKIHLSNLSLFDGKKVSRAGMKKDRDGKNTRVLRQLKDKEVK